MSVQPERPDLRDPRDPFGRRLLTLVGLVVIACGVARLWLVEGTSAVTSGVPLIAIGVGLIVMAAFFDDVGGIVRYFNSEIWFGRRHQDQESAAEDDEAEQHSPRPPTLVEDADDGQPATDETPSSERGPPPEAAEKEAS
jgi:hypothetical protein